MINTKKKTVLAFLLILSIVSIVAAVASYQTILNLFFEKEDVSLIDGNGNVVTGETVKISAPKARDFIFWNTSIGIKPNNPKVCAVKAYFNFTLHDITVPPIYVGKPIDEPAGYRYLEIYVNLVAQNQTIVAPKLPWDVWTIFIHGILLKEDIDAGNRTLLMDTKFTDINPDDIYWIFITVEGIEPETRRAYIELNISLGIKYE